MSSFQKELRIHSVLTPEFHINFDRSALSLDKKVSYKANLRITVNYDTKAKIIVISITIQIKSSKRNSKFSIKLVSDLVFSHPQLNRYLPIRNNTLNTKNKNYQYLLTQAMAMFRGKFYEKLGEYPFKNIQIPFNIEYSLEPENIIK